MKLYHVSFFRIPEPDIRRGRKNADFGQGFYLTPDPGFARRWARGSKDSETFVNCYELSEEGLRVQYLERDEAWFTYIDSNRHLKPELYPEADVIIGPVANDILYDVMGIITSGFLSREEALALLRLGPVYTQAVIKTEKAVRHLLFLKAETLSAEEIEASGRMVREEEKAYQQEVADLMARMSAEEA